MFADEIVFFIINNVRSSCEFMVKLYQMLLVHYLILGSNWSIGVDTEEMIQV